MIHKGTGYAALLLAWPNIFMGAALFASVTTHSVVSDITVGALVALGAILGLVTFYCFYGYSKASKTTPLVQNANSIEIEQKA